MVLVGHSELHHDGGHHADPVCSMGGILSPIVLLFFTANLQGQDT